MNIIEAYQHIKLCLLLVEGENFVIKEVNAWTLKKLSMDKEALLGRPLSSLFTDFNANLEEESIVTLHSGMKVKIRFSPLPQADFLLVQLHQFVESDSAQELQDKESRLQAIINTAVDGIITINQRGIVETINTAAAKLFGYPPEEVLGQNIKMLMPEPYHSQHDGYMHNYQQTGEKKIIGIGREVMAKRKDGSTFPMLLSVSEVKLKDHIIYTGIIHDLTAQKAAEEKVRRYAKELERSNLELQDFAYVSSHDLQEPLRKIRAFGDRLKKESENLSEKGVDYLERMVNAAERMQHLINDLLSFSRVSTHAKAFQEVNLNTIITDVLTDLEYAIEQSDAEIIVEDLPIIEAETVQMRQLFQNLIGNALKFRKPHTHPQIKIYTKLSARKSYKNNPSGENVVKIFVEDNGIGFDEKYKDKIFQIFQRLEGRKYEGSGIGLAICKRIATRHGGDIDVNSSVDVGSVFIVTLPIKQPIIEAQVLI